MWWSWGSLPELEAVLRCSELEHARRVGRRPALPPGRHSPGDGWRAALGGRLVRLGARVAGLDGVELSPALRRPHPDPAA